MNVFGFSGTTKDFPWEWNMKVEEGARLRARWNTQKSPICSHEILSLERTHHDRMTGAYICTTCGALFNSSLLSTPDS